MPIVIRNLETEAPLMARLPLHNNPPRASACCGGAATSGVDACCALDASIKASGGGGCGCNAEAEAAAAAGTEVNTLTPTVLAGSATAECC
jgi:hypothetical protein